MTEAPRVRQHAFPDLDEAVTALRERGLRISTPRRLVLEALLAEARFTHLPIAGLCADCAALGDVRP